VCSLGHGGDGGDWDDCVAGVDSAAGDEGASAAGDEGASAAGDRSPEAGELDPVFPSNST